MHVHTYIRTYVRTYIHTYMRMHACMHACTCPVFSFAGSLVLNRLHGVKLATIVLSSLSAMCALPYKTYLASSHALPMRVCRAPQYIDMLDFAAAPSPIFAYSDPPIIHVLA